MTPENVTPESRESVDQTYRGLRAAMVLLVGLLAAAVVFEIVASALAGAVCLQPSISAYYYTPARPVFVAALSAVGAGLIIYRGTTPAENVLLDFAGFLAFIVSFVPTKIQPDACDATNVPSAAEISSAIANNVTAVLLIGVVAVAVSVWLGPGRYVGADGKLDASSRISAAVCLVALVGGIAVFLLFPQLFARYGHEISATALFGCIVAVVLINANDASKKGGVEPTRRYHQWYRVIAYGMLLAVVGIGLTRWAIPGFTIWLFCVEATLILGFGIFWVVQSMELGGAVARESAEGAATTAAQTQR